MNVVSLATLLVSVDYVLVHAVWEVGAVVALVLDDEGAQVTGVGAIVHATVLEEGGLLYLVVAFHLFAEAVATAGRLLHIAVLDVIHHMETESKMEWSRDGWTLLNGVIE